MGNVLDDLERAARFFPEKKALGDATGYLNYKEFWQAVGTVGDYIRQKGFAETEQPIGVLVERSRWVPVLFLGVVCSGNYYVPINPQLPEEKKEEIIKKAGIRLILTVEELQKILEASLRKLQNGEEKFTITYRQNAEDKPLYLIYTSGSTGEPKGIVKTHGAMLDFVSAFSEAFPVESNEIIGNQTGFSFDASAKDLYLALQSGALLEVLPAELFLFPIKLLEYMNEKKVTTILWVPSALHLMVQMNVFQEVQPTTLKKVFFVGEAISVKMLNQWRQVLPELQYVNLYGFSEIAGICCYYAVKPEENLTDGDVLPMGRPLKNCRVVLADLQGVSVIQEKNIQGELYVASEALAKEYFQERIKTEKTFLMRDFGDGTCRRYFKTGDRAYYNEEGNLVFVSRVDFQIKHRGFRIEPAEIEREVHLINGIQNCGCVYDEKKQQIVLFYTCEREREITSRDIKLFLKSKLPAYMIPTKMVRIDSIPLNSNGKIDRVALKERY